jgi:hypothetical protein
MIPVSKSPSQGDPTDPNPEQNSQGDPRQGQKTPKPEDEPKSTEPESAAKPKESGDPKDRTSKTPPPEGETGSPTTPDVPPWLVNLPEQVRELIVSGDPARVPPAYRDLIVRWHKWLAEKAKGSR